MSIARILLILCGFVFLSYVLYLNWDFEHFGVLKLDNITEVWLVRLLYIYLLLCALYREAAEATEEDFPPYDLVVMIVIVIIPVVIVYGYIKFF